jgi:hypothetical protein
MRSAKTLLLGLVCALAAGALIASYASGSEYNLRMLPEIGRCVRTAGHSEYRGRHCVRGEAGGRYAWFSGASKKGFSIHFVQVKLKSPGNTITCTGGKGEGEYTTPKTFKLKKLTFSVCEQSAKSGIEAQCQNGLGSKNGEVEFSELEGVLGWISHPKKLRVGWDLKPASGSSLASFECGGANAISEKSLGTGIKRELQGSVIGRILPVDNMAVEHSLSFELSKTGGQSPQKFEGGPADTLTTQVETKPSEKTPEATVLAGEGKIKNEEELEALGKCVGSGC